MMCVRVCLFGRIWKKKKNSLVDGDAAEGRYIVFQMLLPFFLLF